MPPIERIKYAPGTVLYTPPTNTTWLMNNLGIWVGSNGRMITDSHMQILDRRVVCPSPEQPS